MPENMRTLHRFARPPTPTLIVIAVVAATFFAAGYLASTLLNDGRVREQSAKRFKEFLTIGTDLGFVTVDRGKLDEIVCIVSEAKWEDSDALERQKGGRP